MSRNSQHICDAADPDPSLERGGFHDLVIQGGVKELKDALKQLVQEGGTFRKVLWSTHGQSGEIGFTRSASDFSEPWKKSSGHEGDRITYVAFLAAEWTDRGYGKLFPFSTKMVFAGCNVAEGDVGWKFLVNAGAFLERRRHGHGMDLLGDQYFRRGTSLILGCYENSYVRGQRPCHWPPQQHKS